MDGQWPRAWQGTRRWFLGAALGGASAGGLALLGCNSGSPGRPPASLPPGATATAPGKQPTPTRPAGVQRGQTLRYTGFVIADDSTEGRYDPQRSQSSPFYGHQSMIFSRLLAYDSQAQGQLAPDLARALPEQPDAQTYVFRLRGDARWQDDPPLNGRPLTAEDVRYTFQRQLDGDPTFVSKASWVNIDKMEVSGPDTITLTLEAPLAPMAARFAGSNAFIVAPETVAAGFSLRNQVGSGPFRWVEWNEGQLASVSRSANWYGGDGRPYLSGVTTLQPRDSDEVEAWLRTRQVDVAFVGRPQADRLRAIIPALQEYTVGQSRFFGMRFFVPMFPYNDARFRTAVSIALDRRAMLERFFAGSGEVNPWVSWPVEQWSLPQAELTTLPGYRPGAEGRAQDIAEAKAMLAAMASERALPADSLGLIVLEEVEKNLGMGAHMRDQLQQHLGLNIQVYTTTPGDLGKRLLTNNAPWAAGPDDGWVDLDDWVYPYFHSAGPRNSFALRDGDLDALIAAQRAEMDRENRRSIGFDIQRRLLGLNAGVNFVSERVVALAWPYVRSFPLDAGDGYQHRFAGAWLDQADPTFLGRS
jgi:peptide/nickel transport system substrate-binding protein